MRRLFLSVLLLALFAGSARADRVDSLIRELASSGDYKVRLSAALNLAKLGDPRSIPAFIDALADSDKTVRGVAAAALGTLVTASTAPALRDRAGAALKKVAAQDANAFVRKQAQKAYDTIRALAPGSSAKAPSVFVQVGDMTDSTPEGTLRPVMRQTVEDTFKKRAPTMAIRWPTGKPPTQRDLDSVKATAFYVDGTLNEVGVAKSGATATVSCKVSMLLATWPGKSMFGFLKGGASVQTGSSTKDIGFAKQDCVAAVVEDLVTSKIIPTIRQRVP